MNFRILGPLEVLEDGRRLALEGAKQRTLLALLVFVGREVELDALRSGLDAAFSGHGRVVLLVGEPGIGKSRLAEDYAHMLLARRLPRDEERAERLLEDADAAYRDLGMT